MNPGRGRQLYDALGNGIVTGAVLIGTGLHNAGRAYTVLEIKGSRVYLEPHLGGRKFWTKPDHYRVDLANNPRGEAWMFERFIIGLPEDAIEAMSGAGAKDAAVEHWASLIARPAEATPEALRAELREYGAWDADQLEDDAANWRRILWIAANNIREDRAQNPRVHRGAQRIRVSFSKREIADFRDSWPVSGLRKLGALMLQLEHNGDVHSSRPAWFLEDPNVDQGAREALIQDARRKAGLLRSNPRPFVSDELERARDTFHMWHEFDSHKTERVRVPSRRIPRHLVKLGEVVRIDYKSNKWEGRPVTYTHSTKRPRPLLVTDPDARQLFIVGGKMRPTADGLIN